MKIKLTLAQLIKLRDSIISELKSNQKAIIKLNSVRKENKEFNRELLLKLEDLQTKLREDLIFIKYDILISNLGHPGDMLFQHNIFKLSELKEELKCYQNISLKEGKFKENGKEVEYSTVLSKETVAKKVKRIKDEIKTIQEKLLEFNSKYVLDLELQHIETFNIASKIV